MNTRLALMIVDAVIIALKSIERLSEQRDADAEHLRVAAQRMQAERKALLRRAEELAED